MSLAAALIYWVIIAIWLSVLGAIGISFARNRRVFGATRLLLAVLVIDTLRNVAENVYFGLYFGGQYGFFPAAIVDVLGNPNYLIIPKVVNLAAACAVLCLLVLRWLPDAQKERADAELEIKRKTDALNQEAEERQRLFETSQDLIIITDRRGVLTRVSPSSLATVGYRPEEMIGRVGAEFIYPEDLNTARTEMRLARRGRNTRDFKCRYVHKDGRIVPLAWSGVWSEPEQRHFFFGRDMTERQAAEVKLWQLAHVDIITKLPNRRSLEADLAALFATDSVSERHTIAIIAIDGVKQINDTLGHAIGDQLLCDVARRIITTSDKPAYRLGGNDFVLLLRSVGDPVAADRVLNDTLAKLAEPFDVDGHKLFVSTSAGVAIAPADGSDADTLLANADLALSDAKAVPSGRRVRQFIPSMRAKAEGRRALDNELRRAAANNEFVLFFQPQVRASDSAIVGAEALLRWTHPQRGVLAPGVFIDALCDSSVSLELGRWILRSACEKAASWRAQGLGDIRIAVNLFPAQFRQSTLLRDVAEALQASGLPPDRLELEITENIALGDQALLTPLKALRDMGVSIAFDDFGTGYASLSCVTNFPLSRIKIDREFVRKLDDGAEQDCAIVRSILMLARSLGLQVTAEGVETVAQAAFLRAEQCEELQGFLFSKPLPQNAFEELLASQSQSKWDRFRKPIERNAATRG